MYAAPTIGEQHVPPSPSAVKIEHRENGIFFNAKHHSGGSNLGSRD